MGSVLRTINLGLRALMEAGVVIAFGYWGYHLGTEAVPRILFTICIPLFVFGFWGLVDFRKYKNAELLRLIQELVITFLAAAALYMVGAQTAGWILAGLSVVHHALVYLLGDKLIKPQP